MRNIIITIFLILIFVSFLEAENQEMEYYKQKIEQLETEIEKLKIEIIETNPLTTGETVKWGKGWFTQSGISDQDSFIFDLGYSKILKKWKPPFQPSYLKNKTGYRLAFSIGFQTFEHTIFDTDSQMFYENSGWGFNFKTHLGTPILLNFISFNTSLKGMYFEGDSSNNKIIMKKVIGIGFNSDIEFWFSQKDALFIGYSSESGFASVTASNENDDKLPLIPNNFRPIFGFKHYF